MYNESGYEVPKNKDFSVDKWKKTLKEGPLPIGNITLGVSTELECNHDDIENGFCLNCGMAYHEFGNMDPDVDMER
jgi:hypothetical protein